MSVLLIDTNLWSYLSAETDPDSLAKLLSDAGHTAVLNSEMLTEALSTSDATVRARIVNMMCSHHWGKLHANAPLMELVESVRRLRPQWLRSIPRTDRLRSMDDYWTHRFYREAKYDQAALVDRILGSTALQEATTEISRIQAANKKVWPFLDGDLETPALLAQTAEDHLSPDPRSRLGWPPQTPVRIWRILARDTTWAYLQREALGRLNGYVDRTYTDTIGAYVDISSMMNDREGFNTLFLFDMDTWDMPRAWWHGTVETLQHATKLADSNGVDAAHASYLPDCDYLLTTDQRFHRVLLAATKTLDAPRGGMPVLVRGHEDGWIEALKLALTTLPPTRQPKRVRTLHVGGSYVVGDGEGQVSARQARKNALKGPVAEIYRGPADLEDTSGNVLLQDIAAVMTNSEEQRPAGVTSKYFGTIYTRPGLEMALAALPVRTVLTLRWRDDQTTTAIYLRQVDTVTGIGIFAVNGNPRPTA
ncbi:hypothetical protein [Pimelobacter simplex]|uniref:hypothetical protein n=1 Tax=Nocardioides simplex TaxID=2045 RepID=UPI00193155C4|nr:hypothetical protein [Pimelobacter simplex]